MRFCEEGCTLLLGQRLGLSVELIVDPALTYWEVAIMHSMGGVFCHCWTQYACAMSMSGSNIAHVNGEQELQRFGGWG